MAITPHQPGEALGVEKLEPEHLAKQRLLGAASRLFIEKGYAATSVNEIVEAAGVAKPTLYYYFKNKEAIYLAIIEDACDRFREVIAERAEPAGPVIGHLLDLAGRIHDLFIQKLDAARLIHAKKYGPPLGTPPFDMSAVESSFMSVFHGIVQRGLDRGEFAGDPNEIVMAVGAILDSCLMAEIGCPCEMRPGREGMLRLLRLLHRGVAAPENSV